MSYIIYSVLPYNASSMVITEYSTAVQYSTVQMFQFRLLHWIPLGQVTSALLVCRLLVCTAQVSHQIYSKTDLMATDSLSPVVGVTVVPPPEFLSSLTQTVFLPTPLPSRQASTSRSTRRPDTSNRDGSYSFR